MLLIWRNDIKQGESIKFLLKAGDIEHYDCERKTIDEVRSYIQRWVDGWMDTCNEQQLKMSATVDFENLKARVNIRYKRDDSMFGEENHIMTLWVEEVK